MKPYQALIWNEWRQMRGNVIALAAVTALLAILMLAGCFDSTMAKYVEMVAATLMPSLPLLYCIVLADSFAREFSRKTDSFLLELPVSSTKIFFCKYSANLMIFLLLSTIAALIMLYLISQTIDMTPGRDSIARHIMYNRLFLVIIAFLIPVHSMLFMASIFGRNTGNSIPALMIMPLLYLLLLFGTMTVTMFFIKNDDIWIISCVCLTYIVSCSFCIGFGWYLWSWRIARGKKILKPVIFFSSIIFIAPIALFGMAYFYASHSYNSAISEAGAAGLETDYLKRVPAFIVPEEQNADAGIMAFNNEYKLRRVHFSYMVTDLLPSRFNFWTKTDFFGTNSKTLPRETILEATDFILNNPHMNQCYIILAEALKKPYCHRTRCSIEQYSTAAAFLSDRAYALRVAGHNDDFFACLAGIDKMANALTELPYASGKESELKLKELEYQTAIAAGPDKQEAMKFYHKMIIDINSINPILPDAVFQYDYLKNISGWFNPKYSSDWSQRGWTLLTLPREFNGAAMRIRWEIQRYKLLEQAAKLSSIKTIETEALLLENAIDKIPDNFQKGAWGGIWGYFHQHSQFDTYKLCLALKLYRIKYGRFPDSLQQLTPEILPKISVNPITGEDYKYHPERGGFYLYGWGSIKYQPWNLEGEKIK